LPINTSLQLKTWRGNFAIKKGDNFEIKRKATQKENPKPRPSLSKNQSRRSPGWKVFSPQPRTSSQTQTHLTKAFAFSFSSPDLPSITPEPATLGHKRKAAAHHFPSKKKNSPSHSQPPSRCPLPNRRKPSSLALPWPRASSFPHLPFPSVFNLQRTEPTTGAADLLLFLLAISRTHDSHSAAHRPASPSTPASTKPYSRTTPSLLSQPVSPVSSTGASAAIDPPSSLSVAAAAEHQ